MTNVSKLGCKTPGISNEIPYQNYVLKWWPAFSQVCNKFKRKTGEVLTCLTKIKKIFSRKKSNNCCLRNKCAKQHWPTKTVMFDTFQINIHNTKNLYIEYNISVVSNILNKFCPTEIFVWKMHAKGLMLEGRGNSLSNPDEHWSSW